MYIRDGGHSIAAVLDPADGPDGLLPVPVRTVLRLGHTINPHGLVTVALPGGDTRYDEDLGLVVPEADDEF